jgi:eukaryotic-like serine/threonine-protein kinase
MRAPDLRPARPGPDEPRSADTIPWKLTVLLDEQSIDWQRGDRTTVETYLAREEALQGTPEAVLNLVYHEVLLRRRHAGEQPTVDEYVARFPHLADALSVQFALDQALPYLSTEPSAPHHEPPPSIQIAGYLLEEMLGRGGMGIVYTLP